MHEKSPNYNRTSKRFYGLKIPPKNLKKFFDQKFKILRNRVLK